MDWEDVPQEQRVSQSWLLRHRKRTYLAHDDHLFEVWWQRLDHPSCHRAVVCVLEPALLSPCALRAAPGERYCPKHGGGRWNSPRLPLRPEEAARYPAAFARLANRTRGTLWRNGYADVAAIRAAGDEELLRLRNFGDRSLADVRAAFGRGAPTAPRVVASHPWWLTP